MDEQPRQFDPSEQPTLDELLEACRSGGEDLSDPELAPLAQRLRSDKELQSAYNRIRLWDRQIQSAVSDVPVPGGLAERLHAAVRPFEPSATEPAIADEEQVARRDRSARTTRRWWIVSSLAAVAALVLAAFLLWPDDEQRMSAEQWAEVVHTQWLAALNDENWKQTFPETLDARYPIDAAVKMRPERWQMVRLTRDPAVVYSSMQPPDRSEALLFVLPTERGTGLPMFPPRRPDSRSRTGNWSIGVWENRGNLYALAVEGDVAQYRTLLRPQPKLVMR